MAGSNPQRNVRHLDGIRVQQPTPLPRSAYPPRQVWRVVNPLESPSTREAPYAPPLRPQHRRAEGTRRLPRRGSHRWPRRFAVVAVVGLAVGGVAMTFAASPPTARVTHAVSSAYKQIVPDHAADRKARIDASVAGIIAAHPNTKVGVSVIDMDSGYTSTLGQTDPFVAASTSKLLTAAAYYNRVESGKSSLQATLGGYPASFQIKQMINQSNNDSWALLNQQVGLSNLENYAHSIGLSSFEVDDNTMTATDEAKLLQLLYERKLVNEEHTTTLLSYMQHTNNEDMIPAALVGDTVFHKYGELDRVLHDAAIVTHGEKTFALVVYTGGASASDYDLRVKLIKQIATAVQAEYEAD